MNILLYLTFLLSLLGGDVNGDLSLEDEPEDELVESQKLIANSQHEPSHPMVERGSSQSNGNTFGSIYPGFVNSFIESLRTRLVPPGCENKRHYCALIPDEVEDYFATVIRQPNLEKLGTFKTTPASTTTLSSYTGPTKHLGSRTSKWSNYVFRYNDPEWWTQWELQDYRTTNIPVMDHNVVPVHDMGYTGDKITIALLGNGVRKHPDLGTSLDTSLGYDFCKETERVYPPYWFSLTGYQYNSECTYHAGVIAMSVNNNICGVGIAPNARIAALKITDCDESGDTLREDMHSRSLGSQLRYIDIYCNTWTFNDATGKMILPITEDVKNAFLKGINEGRDNNGVIFVFPSGRNRAISNCAINGYVNSPYVITIASANQQGKPASYSERCSAVFATAYSGDAGMEGLGTIDANGQCATTPSDLPMGPSVASGIIALLLEARPSLKYRDVMHIIAMTAEVAPLADNPDTWYRNAGGFWVSRDFGFGLLNAENMVNLAKSWKTIPNKNFCVLRTKLYEPIEFDHRESKQIALDAGVCRGETSRITYLEHIEVEVKVKYCCRGAVTINITSPAGTETTLLDPRPKDCSKDWIAGWNIMSTQYWGENPRGPWTITVSAREVYGIVDPHGFIDKFIFKLHGLPDTPEAYPRNYAAFRLPNGQTNL